MSHHLSAKGGIVHSSNFENAIVKMLDEDLDSLKSIKLEMLEPFRSTNNPNSGSGPSPMFKAD
jgi:hypothetical protein